MSESHRSIVRSVDGRGGNARVEGTPIAGYDDRVAFSGSDPIGVLIGAKRPSGTLIHKIAVHPDHRRQGHGRHLLASLGSKLAILGPPRITAEVREALADASGLFNAGGYVEEALLTDYVWQGEEAAVEAGFSRPPSVARLDSLVGGDGEPRDVVPSCREGLDRPLPANLWMRIRLRGKQR